MCVCVGLGSSMINFFLLLNCLSFLSFSIIFGVCHNFVWIIIISVHYYFCDLHNRNWSEWRKLYTCTILRTSFVFFFLKIWKYHSNNQPLKTQNFHNNAIKIISSVYICCLYCFKRWYGRMIIKKFQRIYNFWILILLHTNIYLLPLFILIIIIIIITRKTQNNNLLKIYCSTGYNKNVIKIFLFYI